MKMRYRIVELIVAGSVVVISVASLFVAVHQSIVMERTLAASVWPVMEFQHGNYDGNEGRRSITLDFTNNGLGPAQVRYMRLLDDGQPIDSPQRFFAECCAPEGLDADERLDHVGRLFLEGRLFLVTDVIGGRVFAPQQTVTFARLDYPEDPEVRLVWEALDSIRFQLEVELCYCSVFDDCWLANFPQQTRVPVDQCRIEN
ncbi:hypothetical protein [Maricaulis sp.]|uniref:hypothetical protein n=1 Tax=Maricaulis sp. TaxID=1486257 RepID=UPI003A912F62